MDLEGKRFGSGHRELGGARDLINQYRLWPYHEFFCKRSLPLTIAETNYLHSVVGDTKIRKGKGMELDQLCGNPHMTEKNTYLHPFDLDVLSEAFHMRETDPIYLNNAQKGLPTAAVKFENQSRDKEKMKGKDKDNGRKGGKYRKHRQHQVKDGSCIDNNGIRHYTSHPLHLKIREDKKRRTNPSEDPSVCKRLMIRQ